MDCNIEKNIKNCNCTYPCSRKGKCCECISYHRRMGELPACYFSKDFEKTYNRTIDNYLKFIGIK
ncbi:MAG: hypothetical protein COX07_01765 [Bacteroidetes bacterium CG23_combo_of_CG06-09_8_20_14_all_32_9]|nr:MAG: hypothetical protein COX07_01765 [Bacteroidetes bacterium CG23_combo_of_CG06-09_8_20_14_all_32_9]